MKRKCIQYVSVANKCVIETGVSVVRGVRERDSVQPIDQSINLSVLLNNIGEISGSMLCLCIVRLQIISSHFGCFSHGI